MIAKDKDLNPDYKKMLEKEVDTFDKGTLEHIKETLENPGVAMV